MGGLSENIYYKKEIIFNRQLPIFDSNEIAQKLVYYKKTILISNR